MISKRRRCLGVAWLRRHDQARGTLTIRPSASCATMASLVTSTPTIRGSLVTMLIPCLAKMFKIIKNDLAHSLQFLRLETAVANVNSFQLAKTAKFVRAHQPTSHPLPAPCYDALRHMAPRTGTLRSWLA